jgi:SnoaL-like domain
MTDTLASANTIATVKARYFRLIDTKKFGELEAIFTTDAVFDIEGIVKRDDKGLIVTPGLSDLFPGTARAVVRGRDAMIAFIAGALKSVISVHHGFTPEIQVDRDTACGTWAMEDLFFEPAPPNRRIRHGYGHYHDTFRREADGWRIASITLEFIHEEWFANTTLEGNTP